MLEISDVLDKEISESYSQAVTPVVQATWADNRFLNNLIVSSSSEVFGDSVIKKSPTLYWRFEDQLSASTTTADISGNGLNGTLNGTFVDDISVIQGVSKKNNILTDSFQRADDTEGLGFVESNEYITYEYYERDAIFGIDSNEAVVSRVKSDVTASVPLAVALVNTGDCDGYIKFEIGSTGIKNAQGIVFRYIDNRNYMGWEWVTGGDTQIFKYVNNVKTVYDTTANSLSAGDTVQVNFILDDIEVIKNGSTIINSQTIEEDYFKLNKGTKHGLYLRDYTQAPTATWGPLEIDTFTYLDRSFIFNNTNNYISLSSDLESLSGFADDFTISLWAKTNDIFSTDMALARNRGTVDPADVQYHLVKNNATWRFVYSDGTSTHATSSNTSVVTDEWYMVTITKVGTILTLYLNNQIVGTSTFTGSMPTFTDGVFTVGRYGATNGNYWDGNIDEVFVINNRGLSRYEVSALYLAGINEGTFEGVNYFAGSEVTNLVEEETFAWAVTDCFDEFGNDITSNGDYRVVGDLSDNNIGYGWWTRSKDDTGMVSREITYFEFDERLINSFTISTGYIYGRVSNFEYSYHDVDSDTIYTHTDSFDEDESFKEIEIPEGTLNIDMFSIEVLDTFNVGDYGRIYETNLLYKEDISEDIINFNIKKIRDNYEATLPLGNTAANSGSITLDNISKKYNPKGSGYLAPYIEPDTKLSFGLKWDVDGYEETVYIAKEMYVDSWKLSSDSMQISADIRDFSKILQDEVLTDGFIAENVVAGRAAADILRLKGFPSRKINYWDSMYNTILQSRPVGFWRLNDTGIEAIDEMGNVDGEAQGVGYLRSFFPLMTQDQNPITYKSSRGISAWNGDNTNLFLPTKIKATVTKFTGVDTYIEFDDPDDHLKATADFSIEAIIKPGSIGNGDTGTIVSKLDSGEANLNYILYIHRTGSNYTYKGQIRTSSGLYTVTSQNYISTDFIDQTAHLVLTKNATSLKLYVNGELVGTTTVAGTNETSSDAMTIGEKLHDPGFVDNFLGSIGPVAFYQRELSSSEIQKHFYASQLNAIYVFSYLFSKDESAWDAMLNFATADVGMFYFDENGDFNYEFKDTFHESILTRHRESQYILSDDTNIVDGSQNVDVQANKIVVTVKKPISSSGFKEIWRAEGGQSLAVTTSTATISNGDVTLSITDAEEPLWLSSGYFKMDDEIIFYAGRDGNDLTGLVRGQFGTMPAEHTSGTKVREVRRYQIEYNDAPAVAIKYPFITAVLFESSAEIERFTYNAYTADVIVSATESNSEGDLVILEGTNPNTEIENFFSIAGIPVQGTDSSSKDEQIIQATQSVYPSIRKFRTKELKIENDFIQDKDYAELIAQFLLKFYSLPVPIINLTTHGIPHLQLGDLVTVEQFDQLDINDTLYWVIENTISYDGGLKNEFVLKEYTDGL